MTTKKSALGKGLGALISSANDNYFIDKNPSIEAPVNPASISEIPVDKIVTNPFQPRTSFDQDALEELAQSIKLLGLIQPITVRNIGGKYQIISGERRYRASILAGLKEIPAYILKTDDKGMLEMAIVENIQREDLDAIEVALSFQRLIEECSLTQEEMAQRVGKKRATITNYLRLLKLPVEIQAELRNGTISIGHAKSILSINNPTEQIKLCNLIVKKDLSVRQTESKAKDIQNPTDKGTKTDKKQNIPESHYRILEIVGKYFNNNISLKRSDSGKGCITIQFDSDTEIEAFLKALERNNL